MFSEPPSLSLSQMMDGRSGPESSGSNLPTVYNALLSSPLSLLIQSRVKSLFPMSNVNAYDRAMMFFLVKNTNFCILVQVFLQVFFVPNFLFKIPKYTNYLQSSDLFLVA